MLKDREDATSCETGTPQETKHERERRRALGIYYTPPEAAKVLARWVIRHPEETVLEPSFGGCAMLSAAVSVFKSLGNNSPSRQLYGYDVDATAFEHLAQMGIENADGHFKKQDFLRSKAGDLRVDAVLANPPFVSYHRQNDSQRRLTEQLRQRYLPQLPKLASLWAYFLLHAMSFLHSGGRMAFVLPNAISTADYARPLLTFLQHRFAKVELVHVGERLFIQAGADERISLLLLSGYVPEGLPKAAPLLSRDILRIGEVVVDENSDFSVGDAPKSSDVRDQATAALADLHGDVLVELGSAASVQIGEVVGDIRVFVKPLSAWLQQKVDPKYLVPLLTRSAQVSGVYLPAAENQSGPSAIPYLLLPPERRLPKVIENYLAQYSEQDIAGNKTFEKRTVWYRCSYETDAHAFIGSMSHDYPRIIGNDAGISCSNAFYKITAQGRSDLADWLPVLSMTTPLRLSAEILGRVRGSGGIKLEPSDVRKLCIPSRLPTLPRSEFEAVRERIGRLVGLGELDAAGQLADSLVFLQSGLIDAKTMSGLRMKRLSLTSRRITKPKHGG